MDHITCLGICISVPDWTRWLFLSDIKEKIILWSHQWRELENVAHS